MSTRCAYARRHHGARTGGVRRQLRSCGGDRYPVKASLQLVYGVGPHHLLLCASLKEFQSSLAAALRARSRALGVVHPMWRRTSLPRTPAEAAMAAPRLVNLIEFGHNLAPSAFAFRRSPGRGRGWVRRLRLDRVFIFTLGGLPHPRMALYL